MLHIMPIKIWNSIQRNIIATEYIATIGNSLIVFQYTFWQAYWSTHNLEANFKEIDQRR